MPKTSIKGYKRNSPDKDEPELLIPSNKISMKNVPHKVLGIDNFGYSQIMEPNFDYEFPGDYVIEKPIKRKLQKGGDKNKKPSERKPIITNDPKDPRLKAYNDSLSAYNLTQTRLKQALNKGEISDGRGKNIPVYSVAERQYLDRKRAIETDFEKYKKMGLNLTKKDIEDEYKQIDYKKGQVRDDAVGYYRFKHKNDAGSYTLADYKKPVQPVVYKPKYEDFLKTVNPDYLGDDYDLETAYKELPLKTLQAWAKNPEKNHLPDTYKKPNHSTFSNESIYYKEGMPAGKWEGDEYIPINREKNNSLKDRSLQTSEQNFAENDYSGYDITPIETKPEVQTKKPEKSKYYIQSLDKDGKQKVKYFNSKKEKDDYDNKLSKDFYHSSKTDNSTQYTAILPEFQVGGKKENIANQNNQPNYFVPVNSYKSVFDETNYLNNTQTSYQNDYYVPPTLGTTADFFKTVPKPEPLKPSIVIKPLDVLPKKKPVHTNANINAITAGVTNIGLRRFIEARKNKEDIQNEAIASLIPTAPTINPEGYEKYGNPYVYQSGGIFDIFEQTPIDMSPISFPDVVEPSNNIPENSNKIENTTKDFIKKLEGFTPKAKWDYAQHSVGYGTKAKHKGEEITKEEAEKRLDEELSTITPIINKKLKVPVKQGQMTALISLAYNLGSGSSILKKVIDDINKGEDNNEIADYIRKKGLTGVGSNKIIPGLVNRRKKEATMFLSEYEQGGEYSLEDEDIQNLINQGYEIEYLD